MASELDSVREQRNITFELCAWGFGNVETFGSQMGHLWRTSQDITDTWHGLLWNIDVNDEVNLLELLMSSFHVTHHQHLYFLTGAIQASWCPRTRVWVELPRWAVRWQGHHYDDKYHRDHLDNHDLDPRHAGWYDGH